MKIIKRDYLNELIDIMDTPDIKVITGVRRSGKSELLKSFALYLTNSKQNNIISINFNDRQYDSLLKNNNLYEYISNQYDSNKKNFILIDEIQMYKNFERDIISLHNENKYSIYLTGSNAFLLSSDLATLFGGRVYEISLFPFSFKEFNQYFESNDIYKSFEQYFILGGMAGSYLYKTLAEKYKYITNVYNSSIVRDIVTKDKIENELLLELIIYYLMDKIGNKTSLRNITNSLNSNTFKTNHKSVGSYLSYLTKSFMFYPIQRYDIAGKKYLETDKKYYLTDLSFRFAMLGTKKFDYGRLYENIVAIELLRRGYEVYVGTLYDKEIDFVAIKNGTKFYIQVCADLDKSPETRLREIKPLKSIRDGYKKIILTISKHEPSNIDGIEIIDLARWLQSIDNF